MRTDSSKSRRHGIASVRSKNTKPEMIVRRMLHAQGYRYCLHRSDLPGSPDLVFPSRKKVVFVHGCFWHGHSCKNGRRIPKRNTSYWRPKIARNVARDAETLAALATLGWQVMTVWECEIRDEPNVLSKLVSFLGE